MVRAVDLWRDYADQLGLIRRLGQPVTEQMGCIYRSNPARRI